MHVVMCLLPQQSPLPFPLCIPTQSCFVQYSVSENAPLFGLLWAVLTIWLRFALPSSKILQCFSLFIETHYPIDK